MVLHKTEADQCRPGKTKAFSTLFYLFLKINALMKIIIISIKFYKYNFNNILFSSVIFPIKNEYINETYYNFNKF